MAPSELRKKRFIGKKKLAVDGKSGKGDFKKRKTTLKKKARQLQTLCDVKVCMVCFGSDGEVVTWPENKAEVHGIINEFRGILGGEAKVKAKQDNLSSFLGSNRKKIEQKLNRGNELPDEAENNEALNKVLSGWEAKLSELSEGDLRSLCNYLDSKLQILRDRIGLLQFKENENLIQVYNGDNLEPNTYFEEGHRPLFPLQLGLDECYSFDQPVDVESTNFLLGENTNDKQLLPLNHGDNSDPSMCPNECHQPSLPLLLLDECNTSGLLVENSNDFSTANMDNNLLINNYFSYPHWDFSVQESFGSLQEIYYPFHPMFP